MNSEYFGVVTRVIYYPPNDSAIPAALGNLIVISQTNLQCVFRFETSGLMGWRFNFEYEQ